MQSMWHYKLKFAVVLSLWLQNTHKLQVLIDGKPPREAFTNSPRKELSQKNPYKFYLYYVWILKTGKGCKWFKRDLQASDSCWIFPLGLKSWQSWCTLYFFFWVNIKFHDWRKQSKRWLSLVLSQDGTHCDTVHVFVSSNLNVNFLTLWLKYQIII